jgi:hypothetical protein
LRNRSTAVVSMEMSPLANPGRSERLTSSS